MPAFLKPRYIVAEPFEKRRSRAAEAEAEGEGDAAAGDGADADPGGGRDGAAGHRAEEKEAKV